MSETTDEPAPSDATVGSLDSAESPPATDASASGRPAAKTREDREAEERARLLNALSTGVSARVIERVALVLSRHPETRDNDQALQIRYWREYEPEAYARLAAEGSAALYRLTPLTTITRARRRIQYTHGLFAASEAVRRRRGALSEEMREHLMNPPAADPSIIVYADESGKTEANLVVGSVWFIDAYDTATVARRLAEWRHAAKFDDEFHFAKLTPLTLPLYREAVEHAIKGVAGVSFKSLTVPRVGVANVSEAIDQLFVELFRRGVGHEHASGRARLPRRLTVYKDLEAEGRDKLLMARVRSELAVVSATEFDGRLHLETLEALSSKGDDLLQLADLYTASINRTLARTAGSARAKDAFADFLLDLIRPAVDEAGRVGDIEVHIRL